MVESTSRGTNTSENEDVNVTALLSTQDLHSLISVACDIGPLGLINSLFTDLRVDLSANKNAAIKTAAENGHCRVVQLLLDDFNLNPGNDANFRFEMSCRAGDVESVHQLLNDPFLDPKHCVEALAPACRLGRTEVVRLLLEDGRINPAPTSGLPIYLAAANSHCDVLELLLADIRIENPALACFAGAGDVQRVQELLKGLETHSLTYDPVLAVQWASQFGRLSVVKLLLNDMKLRNVGQPACCNHALTQASIDGHAEVVKLLLAANSVVNPSEFSNPNNFLMNSIAKNGHGKVIEVLMQDPRINIELSKTFEYRCGVGNTRLARESLTETQLDSSSIVDRALQLACFNGHIETVNFILTDSRIDFALNVNRAMELASRHGHNFVVKVLLSDPHIDPGTNRAIEWASRNGHLKVVKLLLADSRVKPAMNDNFAVRLACLSGSDSVVKLLLNDPRVNPAAAENEAIKGASEYGYAAVVKLLIADPRVDPSAANNTALHKASQNGFASVVNLLLTDERVVAGESSALLTACEFGRVGVVRLLLARPHVFVTREHLVVADVGARELVIKQLIAERPHVMLDLFCNPTECVLGGSLWAELKWWEARSAKAMLLCVKRIQSDVVAARVGDVLRDVVEEFVCFDVVSN